MGRSLLLLFVAKSEELESDGHQELALSGVVDIDVAEVEIVIHGGGTQVVEDFAQAEVVVDVEGDTPEEVDADAGLQAPGDGFGVESLITHSLLLLWVHRGFLPVDGVGLVIQGLRIEDKVGRGSCLYTQRDNRIVDNVEADQYRKLKVHLGQCHVDIGTGGKIE